MLSYVSSFFTRLQCTSNFEENVYPYNDDVLGYVFSFFSFKELIPCCFVCKKWKNILEIKLRTESLLDLWNLSKELRIVKKLINVENRKILVISSITAVFFFVMLKKFNEMCKKAPAQIFYYPILFLLVEQGLNALPEEGKVREIDRLQLKYRKLKIKKGTLFNR